MRQFCVYANRDARSKALYPLLLDVQSDLLQRLDTRVVVPLLPLAQGKAQRIDRLAPVLAVDGSEYVMMTALLAAISARQLSQEVGCVRDQRDTVIAALDMLISGI